MNEAIPSPTPDPISAPLPLARHTPRVGPHPQVEAYPQVRPHSSTGPGPRPGPCPWSDGPVGRPAPDPDLPAAGATWWSSDGSWEPAGWADPAASAFRASYTDPARVQTLAAGPLFDVLSVGMAVGLEAARLLLADRLPLGPVALDNRSQVRRVGFLLPPDTFRRAGGFAWWCRSHAMRTVSHGDVVALPPLIGDGSARFRWLVPPGAHGVAGSDPAVLLTGLRRVLRAGRGAADRAGS